MYIKDSGLLEAGKALYNTELCGRARKGLVERLYNGDSRSRVGDKWLALAIIKALYTLLKDTLLDELMMFGVGTINPSVRLRGSFYTLKSGGSRLHGFRIRFGSVDVAMDLGGIGGVVLGELQQARRNNFRQFTQSNVTVSAPSFMSGENDFIICLAPDMQNYRSYLHLKAGDRDYIPVTLLGESGACRDFRAKLCQEVVRQLQSMTLPSRFSWLFTRSDEVYCGFSEADRVVLVKKVQEKLAAYLPPGFSLATVQSGSAEADTVSSATCCASVVRLFRHTPADSADGAGEHLLSSSSIRRTDGV